MVWYDTLYQVQKASSQLSFKALLLIVYMCLIHAPEHRCINMTGVLDQAIAYEGSMKLVYIHTRGHAGIQ